MLKVEVTYQNEFISEVTFLGHALYDDYGKDIVCAAASSILITSVNGINSFDEENLEVIQEKDKVVVKVLKQNDITKVLITNMVNLLKDLEKDYPEHIKIS